MIEVEYRFRILAKQDTHDEIRKNLPIAVGEFLKDYFAVMDFYTRRLLEANAFTQDNKLLEDKTEGDKINEQEGRDS